MLPNLPLQRLLKGGELIRFSDELDQSMKERQNKEKGQKIIEQCRQNMSSKFNKMSNVGAGGLEDADMMDDESVIAGVEDVTGGDGTI